MSELLPGYSKWLHNKDGNIIIVLTGGARDVKIKQTDGEYTLIESNTNSAEQSLDAIKKEIRASVEASIRAELEAKLADGMKKAVYDSDSNAVVDRAERADAMAWQGNV